jgi:hypothetical protein
MWREGARAAGERTEEKSGRGVVYVRAGWGAAVLRPYITVADGGIEEWNGAVMAGLGMR